MCKFDPFEIPSKSPFKFKFKVPWKVPSKVPSKAPFGRRFSRSLRFACARLVPPAPPRCERPCMVADLACFASALARRTGAAWATNRKNPKHTLYIHVTATSCRSAEAPSLSKGWEYHYTSTPWSPSPMAGRRPRLPTALPSSTSASCQLHGSTPPTNSRSRSTTSSSHPRGGDEQAEGDDDDDDWQDDDDDDNDYYYYYDFYSAPADSACDLQ